MIHERRINLTLTEEEFQSVERAARSAHLKRSTFIKKLVLDEICYTPAIDMSDSGSTNDVDTSR